jgi:hypothetical protein
MSTIDVTNDTFTCDQEDVLESHIFPKATMMYHKSKSSPKQINASYKPWN